MTCEVTHYIWASICYFKHSHIGASQHLKLKMNSLTHEDNFLNSILNYLKLYEIFMAVVIWIVVFWVATQYSLASGCQCFGGTYRLHLQGND
jgi:hypothetical protein